MNRNELNRLRRVQKSMERVLTDLHRARGEAYPLRDWRTKLNELVADVESLAEKIAEALSKENGHDSESAAPAGDA